MAYLIFPTEINDRYQTNSLGKEKKCSAAFQLE